MEYLDELKSTCTCTLGMKLGPVGCIFRPKQSQVNIAPMFSWQMNGAVIIPVFQHGDRLS